MPRYRLNFGNGQFHGDFSSRNTAQLAGWTQ